MERKEGINKDVDREEDNEATCGKDKGIVKE